MSKQPYLVLRSDDIEPFTPGVAEAAELPAG